MSLGFEIGQGKKVDQIIHSGKKTFEGLETSKSLIKLAEKLGVDVPLCKAIAKILQEDKTQDQIKKIITDIILM
jgi:glycerol-3-phosphate dehydrogenase (NAD(P)+)